MTDKDINLIEVITDFNDSISVDFGNHLKKVCDYSKFPIKEIIMDDWNSPTFKISNTTKVIVVQNTLKLKDSTLERLLKFVSQGGLLFGLNPDSQRYFDYHHTPIDVWDAVNKRELQLGVAAITSLVYLIDKYGL